MPNVYAAKNRLEAEYKEMTVKYRKGTVHTAESEVGHMTYRNQSLAAIAGVGGGNRSRSTSPNSNNSNGRRTKNVVITPRTHLPPPSTGAANSSTYTIPPLFSFSSPKASPRTKPPRSPRSPSAVKSPRKNITSPNHGIQLASPTLIAAAASPPQPTPSFYATRHPPPPPYAAVLGDFSLSNTFVHNSSILPSTSSSYQYYTSHPVTFATREGNKIDKKAKLHIKSNKSVSITQAILGEPALPGPLLPPLAIMPTVVASTQTDESNTQGTVLSDGNTPLQTRPLPQPNSANESNSSFTSPNTLFIPNIVSHFGNTLYEITHAKLLEINAEEYILHEKHKETEHESKKKNIATAPSTSQAITDPLSHFYAHLENWDLFDIFALYELTQGWPLSYLFMMINKKHRFLEACNIDLSVAFHFIQEVESNYLPNPYHTATHAADVLHGAYHLVEYTPYLKMHLSPLDKFTLYISCAIHDFQHPGVNNSFLVNSRAPLAVRYNDRSVLESFHVSGAFRMMTQKEHCNILKSLPFVEYSKIRKILIDLVLSTDLAVHFELMGLFKRKLQGNSINAGTQSVSPSNTNSPAPPALDVSVEEDKNMIMQILLKCGDLSHPSRPRKLHLKWSELVTEEFFQQGDRERALNLPPSMFMDRHSTNLAQSQIGFINFLVLPMFTTYASFSSCDYWAKKVEENLEWWRAVAKQEEEEKERERLEALEAEGDDTGDASASESEPTSAFSDGSDATVRTLRSLARTTSIDPARINMIRVRRQSTADIDEPDTGASVAGGVQEESDSKPSSQRQTNEELIIPSDLNASPDNSDVTVAVGDEHSGTLRVVVMPMQAVSFPRVSFNASNSRCGSNSSNPSTSIHSPHTARLSRSSSRVNRSTSRRNRRSMTHFTDLQDEIALSTESAQVAALSAAGASALEAKEHAIEDVELQKENALHAEAAALQHNQASVSTAGISSGSNGTKSSVSALLTVSTLSSTLRRKSLLKGTVPPPAPFHPLSPVQRAMSITGSSSQNSSPKLTAFNSPVHSARSAVGSDGEVQSPAFVRTVSWTDRRTNLTIMSPPRLTHITSAPPNLSATDSPLLRAKGPLLISTQSTMDPNSSNPNPIVHAYNDVHERVRKMASVAPIPTDASSPTPISPPISTSQTPAPTVPPFSARAHALIEHPTTIVVPKLTVRSKSSMGGKESREDDD